MMKKKITRPYSHSEKINCDQAFYFFSGKPEKGKKDRLIASQR